MSVAAIPQDKAMPQALRMIEKLCSGTLRAIGGDPRQHFHFHNPNAHVHSVRELHVPWFYCLPEQHSFQYCRGAADGLALMCLHCDLSIHTEYAPKDNLERALFDALEHFRCEYVSDTAVWPGVFSNIEQTFTMWCEAYMADGLIESQLGVSFLTLLASFRVHIVGKPLDHLTEDSIETTRNRLIRPLGSTIQAMKRARYDQKSYAIASLAVIESLQEILQEIEEKGSKETKQSTAKLRQQFSVLNAAESEEDLIDDAGGFEQSEEHRLRWISDQLQQYQPYDTQFDEELDAASLLSLRRRKKLREQLDEMISNQGLNLPRLTQQWRNTLAKPQPAGWRFGEEEGILDGSRLARIVTSPGTKHVFKQINLTPNLDVAVTLLLDNSGSMRRLSMGPVAVMADVLTRSFEQAGAKVELLGFTTGNKSSGRLLRDWRQRGEPENPGRLNEIKHIIYKSFDKRWRQARPDIATLLNGTHYRESVDGEALLWASQRLLQRSESRKILFIVSDGLPMDNATALANGEAYLHQHLHAVAQHLERDPRLELYALGVGLDLSPWYQQSLMLALEKTLNNKVFDELNQSLSRASLS